MLNIKFPFGKSEVAVLNHRTNKEGLIHHKADIRTSGFVHKTYLKHEIIDLVSESVGFSPLTFRIVGSRVVLEKGLNHYELHWQTTSGRV